MQGLDVIMISAFRYGLGRRTYIVREIVDFIKTNYKELNEVYKNIIIQEIEEAEENNRLGDIYIDAPEWIELKKFLEEKLVSESFEKGDR